MAIPKEGEINHSFQGDLELDIVKLGELDKTNSNNIQINPVINETKERQQWSRPIEFLLSCIALSVGLGNVWRFPFVAYENGGAVFLIPYFTVLFLIGKPLYFLEMSIGQFSSSGHIKMWDMAPLFKGVGATITLGASSILSYYVSIMAITLFYMFSSFQSELPWTICQDNWEGYNCSENGTEIINAITGESVAIPKVYFDIEVIKRKMNIDDGIGLPDLRLSFYLLIAWLIIFVCLIKGVKSSGKIAYVTAIFPYFVLIIFLIRGLTLPGSMEGIIFFLNPNWSKILEPSVWMNAAGQCFFSLSTCIGPIVMLASHNPFRHNAYRDAIIISILDTFTSLLSGLTIFAVLGNLSFQLGKDVSDVVEGGPALAFISYPQAISKFDFAPQFFSVLFFIMLFVLGLGSANSLAGCLITVLTDQMPNTNKKFFTALICICGFLIGLIYVTPGGQFMITLVDHFGAVLVVYVAAIFESIGIIWVYGLNNVCRDIKFMLGFNVSIYWRFCWSIVIPIGLISIFIYSLIDSKELKEQNVSFPYIAIVFGWLILANGMAVIIIGALYAIFKSKSSSLYKKILESLKPNEKWGPKNKILKSEWEKL